MSRFRTSDLQGIAHAQEQEGDERDGRIFLPGAAKGVLTPRGFLP